MERAGVRGIQAVLIAALAGVASAAAGAEAAASAASAASMPAAAWVAADPRFIYAVVVVVLGASVVSLLLIRSALTVSVWSFSDALSEPTEVTATEPDANGVLRIKLDADGKPLMVTKMLASSSRVLALMGAVVILLMFLGFGSVALFSFASTGELPASMDRVVNYLLAGMTLFAPYVVNKFSGIFTSLSPKRS
jgi:hypothetical protein